MTILPVLDITSQKHLKMLGGEVVAETFPEGNSDFASYITSAKNCRSRCMSLHLLPQKQQP